MPFVSVALPGGGGGGGGLGGGPGSSGGGISGRSPSAALVPPLARQGTSTQAGVRAEHITRTWLEIQEERQAEMAKSERQMFPGCRTTGLRGQYDRPDEARERDVVRDFLFTHQRAAAALENDTARTSRIDVIAAAYAAYEMAAAAVQKGHNRQPREDDVHYTDGRFADEEDRLYEKGRADARARLRKAGAIASLVPRSASRLSSAEEEKTQRLARSAQEEVIGPVAALSPRLSPSARPQSDRDRRDSPGEGNSPTSTRNLHPPRGSGENARERKQFNAGGLSASQATGASGVPWPGTASALDASGADDDLNLLCDGPDDPGEGEGEGATPGGASGTGTAGGEEGGSAAVAVAELEARAIVGEFGKGWTDHLEEDAPPGQTAQGAGRGTGPLEGASTAAAAVGGGGGFVGGQGQRGDDQVEEAVLPGEAAGGAGAEEGLGNEAGRWVWSEEKGEWGWEWGGTAGDQDGGIADQNSGYDYNGWTWNEEKNEWEWTGVE
uniref:Uncharacterized protein n=1 Tax=Chromera velia CCMP2878 TaxID=1169474 RepID=A0A0G4H309_9ALVE|eukprot:Cvel_24502.t1-p1 / transcript=Cvel_24502.t1 / gene=Cvel_24502 / organism=Chromera_velia_CCMP2878 / gene_product=hypothetical protein / transcript_product=hypothetical protein / location=Cvel_scaffold2657:22504-24511(-) / protein_length=496 / sequence_SO=supercontig / SO=protein_coding / is_pseudo=false